MTDLNVYELMELFLAEPKRRITLCSGNRGSNVFVLFQDQGNRVIEKVLLPTDDMRQFRQLLKAAIEQTET